MDKGSFSMGTHFKLFFNRMKGFVNLFEYILSSKIKLKRVIVDGHGCHTALHFGVEAKENQDKVPTLYWLPKLHKTHIKQDLLLILVIVRRQIFFKLLTPCLTAVKNMLSSTVKRYMRDLVKTYFGLSKFQVKF